MLAHEFIKRIEQLPAQKRRAVAVFVNIASENPSFTRPLTDDRKDSLLDIIREFVEAFAEDTGGGT